MQNYVRQLSEGDGYSDLRPAISICLLDRRMFPQPSETDRYHHSFRLRCDQNVELVLTNDLEFHVFELPKYRPSSDNIRQLPADEKWLYLFTTAAEMDPEELARLLDDSPYREALGVLQMISKSPEDLQYYEARLKFLRDEQGKLLAAREEGERLGLQKGERLGLQKGERLGLEKGEIIGKIRLVQELLGETPSTADRLSKLMIDELTAMLADLQQSLRDRRV
ncbi:MAG: PD-(D/E)XK nuclease family transposase [Pirellulaceae bacterium]